MTDIRVRRTPPDGFGAMLRGARERAGIGLRETARRVRLSPGYLAGLEAGNRCPSRTVAQRLAGTLALDAAERVQLNAAAVDDAGADHPWRAMAGAEPPPTALRS